jgi:hypothetical protein
VHHSAKGPTHFGPFFRPWVPSGVTPQDMCGKKTVLRCLDYTFPLPHAGSRHGGVPDWFRCERHDREVIETMTRDGQNPRNDAHKALYALMAGAEGCGPAARIARQAQDHELADFLAFSCD